MPRALFAPAARVDLIEIHEFIARDNRAAAGALIERFEAKAAMLAASPGVGRARPDLRADLRSFAVGMYVIFYRLANEGIEVIRVYHGARDHEALFGTDEDFP